MSDHPTDTALLTPQEMATADRLTIAAGTSSIALMERAGAAVAEVVADRVAGASRIGILAGPGNNGGDAFVAARILAEAGHAVRLHLLGERSALKGDAAQAAATFQGEAEPLSAFDPSAVDFILDGLFGAGLARAIEGDAAEAIRRLNDSGKPVVAIDLPSGISGLTGAELGIAVKASATVTFFRRKPGHLLEPGRSHCGETAVADIGIASDVLRTIAPTSFANEPALWQSALLRPSDVGHKYDRGHAVVFSGGATKTGAARMSAMACLRTGAGLVTLFSPSSALLVNATHLTAIMLERCEDAAELRERLSDKRLNAFVIGPGFGIGEKARGFVRAVLEAGRSLVIDADAISSFKDEPEALFEMIRASEGEAVLTPHAGEFGRLFPDLAGSPSSKLEKAREAAARSGAVVVFKGSDTVIAAPDGRAAINGTGSSYLATAGTGDVLAGMIGGWLAQKVPAFEAAAAAVWMHGMAGLARGPGLIAEDLPHAIPGVLRRLWE